jgi:hypothetical protein
MKVRKIALCLPFLFLVALSNIVGAQFSGNPAWVYGYVASLPAQVTYSGTVYYTFNLTAVSSNASNLEGLLVAVITSVSNLVQVTLSLGQPINMSGVFSDGGFGIPQGIYIAESIETYPPDWTKTLGQLWALFGQIGRLLVTLIIQIVSAFTGLVLPEWIVALILVGVIAFGFLRWGRRIPWILLICMFFSVVGLISHLLGILTG